MNAIEIKNLCKSYKDFEINNLNLTLPGGYIMGLVGENGAGKSTTIKLILNMVNKDSGSITVLGRDNSVNFELTKEDIGIVLDEVGFSSFFTAKDIDKIMAHTYKNWSSEQFYSYLNKLSLPGDKKFKDLSRGMKMKLGIAVALSHDPKLLILDEATNGLDPVVRDEVTDLFMEFTRDENHSILISSHIVSDLEKICDYIAFMHKGKIILCEEKDKLREDYAVIGCTEQQLSELNQSAVIGLRKNSYGVSAAVRKNEIPSGFDSSPITVEELFVFMLKGEK